MKTFVYVLADTNDADYTGKLTEVSDEPINVSSEGEEPMLIWPIELIRKFAKAVSECKDYHNWPRHENSNVSIEEFYAGVLSEAELAILEYYTPHGEYGIHTIKEVKLLHVEDCENLFKQKMYHEYV